MAAFFVSIDGGRLWQVDSNSTLQQGSMNWDNRCCWCGSRRHAVGRKSAEILLHRCEIPLTTTAEMLLYTASRAQLVEELIERPGRWLYDQRSISAGQRSIRAARRVDTEQLWQVGQIATRDGCPI